MRYLVVFLCIFTFQIHGLSDEFKTLVKKHFPDNKAVSEVLEAMKEKLAEVQNITSDNSTNSLGNTTTHPINDFPLYNQQNMDDMANFFSQLMNCAFGWCSYRCCDAPAGPLRPSLQFIHSPTVTSFPVMHRMPKSQYAPSSPKTLKALPVARGLPAQPKPVRKLRHKIVSTTMRSAPPIMARYPQQQHSLSATTVPQSRTVRRRPAVTCPKACQPTCASRCLKRYNEIVYEFMNSLTQTDVLGLPEKSVQNQYNPFGMSRASQRNNGWIRNNVEETPWELENEPWLPQIPTDEDQPLCRAECMPLCLENCIVAEPPKQCRPTCMPACTPACLQSPALMIPCSGFDSCICPVGYVQCSDNTCCMRYRSMAVRYKDKLAAFKFSDDDKPAIEGIAGNQTAVYMQHLRSMGGEHIKPATIDVKGAGAYKELPNNATIVFFPDEKKAEIVMNDGLVMVEKVEN